MEEAIHRISSLFSDLDRSSPAIKTEKLCDCLLLFIYIQVYLFSLLSLILLFLIQIFVQLFVCLWHYTFSVANTKAK